MAVNSHNQREIQGDKMNIVYSSSRALYPYLNASIKSLVEHNKVDKLYILAQDDEVPVDAPHEVINISEQKYFQEGGPNRGPNNYFTIMSMIRCTIPELIDEDKVICLDVDTVICDSLLPLWEIPLEGKWLAWCPEWIGHWSPYGTQYHNFGVTVMNLKQMRQDKLVPKMVEILNTTYYRFIEQDLFNQLAVPEMSVDIPVRYNECFCCGYTDNPAVIHFAGYADWFKNAGLYRREYLTRYL